MMVKAALYLIWAAVCVYLLFQGKKTPPEQQFNKEMTGTVRGVATVGIMLCHISSRLQASDAILSALGYLGAGIFMFIAGYGNEISLSRREAKLKWMSNKVTKIYVPTLVCYLLTLGVQVLLVREDAASIPLDEMLVGMLCLDLPMTTNWFAKVIFGAFVFHWLTRKVVHCRESEGIVVLALCVLFIAAARMLQMASFFYTTILCYGLGALMVEYGKYLRSRWCAVLCAGLFAVTFVLIKVDRIADLMQIVACAFLSLTLFALSAHVTFSSSWLKAIGDRSFEYYLFHLMWCYLLKGYIGLVTPYGYIVLIFVVTYWNVELYYQAQKLLSRHTSTRKGADL